MGMQLNIKSDEAYRMASELAELTGESLTAAVLEALRQRLEAERKARDKERLVAEVLALGAEIRLLVGPEAASTDTDFFYDEDGFPSVPI